jgi:DNA helicase II / ATP-dependent DNA helicase PcrA
MGNANYIARPADMAIASCIDGQTVLKSYFLLAGAGSGKTGALVYAVEGYLRKYERDLRELGKRIGVITYTNAAADEIARRLGFNPVVAVSTIHSFCWSLISGYDHDIRIWMKRHLELSVVELEQQQVKGRPSSAAYQARAIEIPQKRERIQRLDEVQTFTYNPNGEHGGLGALSHSDVLSLAADFIANRPAMKTILVSRFPLLMIDECQDTKDAMMLAFLKVEAEHSGRWSLGLYGDTMQKIYGDGVPNLRELVPAHWKKPSVTVNHRSGSRIIDLINSIRHTTDDYQQTSVTTRGSGHVRIFLIPRSGTSKADSEARVATLMGQASGDEAWFDGARDYKILILEHRMAAQRLGFNNLYSALAAYDSFKTGLATGEISGLKLFTAKVLPLLMAHRAGDAFETARIVRESSPLLSRRELVKGTNGQAALTSVRSAVTTILKLWDHGAVPTCGTVLQAVRLTGLFDIPDDLLPLVDLSDDLIDGIVTEGKASSGSEARRLAWCRFLQIRFLEVEQYMYYLTGDGPFGTHQGVKGLEYPRVMVVIDDEEAGGFLFSYDKLFGLVAPSERDVANEREGKDTAMARTRRLFYVTCSRARDSLAVVCYVSDPVTAEVVINRAAWFRSDEIIVM